MILVSACLAGENCRYDGKSCLFPAVRELVRRGRAVAERHNDFTPQYTLGARATLFIARANNISTAILKSLSPSCGFGEVYDGSFTGARTGGQGVTARLLAENGIRVYTEDQMPPIDEL